MSGRVMIEGGHRPKPAGINPKQAQGDRKVPFDVLPWPVVTEMAVGFAEGAARYGAHNWRTKPVLASTYIAAAMRHLVAYAMGEDTDLEGAGQSHLTKAMTSLAVLRDAQIHGCAVDDRAPSSPPGLMAAANAATVAAREAVGRAHSLPPGRSGRASAPPEK